MAEIQRARQFWNLEIGISLGVSWAESKEFGAWKLGFSHGDYPTSLAMPNTAYNGISCAACLHG
jgi:hypothetical protein